ncbi:MAG: hypothetical protein R6W76_05570, partial [Caldilinea sp.]
RAHQLQAALITIWGLVNRANQYVDQTAPFKLAKDPAQATRLVHVGASEPMASCHVFRATWRDGTRSTQHEHHWAI